MRRSLSTVLAAVTSLVLSAGVVGGDGSRPAPVPAGAQQGVITCC